MKKLRKVINVSSDVDGYITVSTIVEAKKIAKHNIKKGIRTSIYVDWFDTDENIDPIRDEAYFTNDDCTALYKAQLLL